MHTPHERLTTRARSSSSTASPITPPTAVPFLEQLAETHRVVAPWLRGYAPSPIVGPYDRRWFDARVLEVVPNLGHFLHIEAPATRVARWLA